MDYLQNDEDLVSNNQPNNVSTPSPDHQTGSTNHFTRETTTQSTSEKFCYTCTVCREVLGDSQELLKHLRTHTRLKTYNCAESQNVSCLHVFRAEDGIKLTQIDFSRIHTMDQSAASVINGSAILGCYHNTKRFSTSRLSSVASAVPCSAYLSCTKFIRTST